MKFKFKFGQRIIARALSERPESCNLSGVAEILNMTPTRFWFYVKGHTRIRADDFLFTLAALGCLRVRFAKDGQPTGLTIDVPLDPKDVLQVQALNMIDRANFETRRKSKLLKRITA